MKRILGIWLPDGDEHFERMMLKAPMGRYGRRLVGTYQRDKLLLALKRTKRRRTAVDIGAHVGFWSMWLAPEFRTVHSFEPMIEHVECFRRNVASTNVTLHRCALGERIGFIGMEADAENSGKAHIGGNGTIPMLTLDYFNLPDVDLLKIDVEGYEPQVLAGAAQTIARCRPVVIVEQKGHHERYGNEAGQALEALQALGMEMRDQLGGDFIFTWK